MTTKTEVKHTPTPFIKCRFCENHDTLDHQYNCLLKDQPLVIVRAVNSHDKAIAWLKTLANDPDAAIKHRNELEAFIAKAESK